MSLNRRDFVQRCSAMTALAAFPAFSTTGYAEERTRESIAEIDPRALAQRAVDAARAAGATYADARLTRTLQRTLDVLSDRPDAPSESEDIAIGVRALVNGIWGFVASCDWSADEAAALGRAAALQAKVNGFGQRGGVELETAPAVTGNWIMPVKYDPFTMSIDEQLDDIQAIHSLVVQASRDAVARSSIVLMRQEKTFASTDGSLVTQTLFMTTGGFTISLPVDWRTNRMGAAGQEGMSASGRGWESYRNAGLADAIPTLIATAEEQRRRTSVAAEMGRAEVVFDAQATAMLLDQTIGAATELDRALGTEANASGTSYLSDPLTMLGTTRIGAPLLTVTADRSSPGGAATVAWDDEGVVPNACTLVADGMLNDFQTTREQSAWLAPWYQRRGVPVRSHGCATAPSAMFAPIQHTPNLKMRPAAAEASFEELVSQVRNGVAMTGGRVRVEQQRLNGSGEGLAYRIRDGKLAEFLDGAGYLFRAPELWSNVRAVGGAKSQRWIGLSRTKGQPLQGSFHSVAAVPMHVTDVRIIEARRRA